MLTHHHNWVGTGLWTFALPGEKFFFLRPKDFTVSLVPPFPPLDS